MKLSLNRHYQYGIILAFVAAISIGELILFLFSGGNDHELIHSVLETTSMVLIVVAIGLASVAYFAYRRAQYRSARLKIERDKTRKLAAKLASHKAGVDAHAIVSIADKDGRITYVNDKFCQISKYSEAELIGQNHRMFNSGRHPADFFRDMYETIAEGKVWSGEICNKAKDGSEYWVYTTLTPCLNENGDLEEVFSIRTDISDIKENEEKLRQTNQILHSTFKNFPGAISAYDGDLILQLANPAFYELLNIPADRFPAGSSFEDMIRYNAENGQYGDGDIEEMVSERMELARQFVAHQFERTTADGNVLEVKGWPLQNGGFVSAHIDVTERHRMIEHLKQKNEEAELTASELKLSQNQHIQTHQHLLNSVNSMQNGFVIWDKDGTLLLANDAFRRFNAPIASHLVPGLKFKEMLKLGLEADFWALNGQEAEDWVKQRVEDHRKAENVEREVRFRDGTLLVIAESRLENGDIISTYTDVTAHRDREAELTRARDALQHIAYFDALTTLPNRAHCQQDLEALFRNRTVDSRFSIIQIDLDKFKRVNDTMGHMAGDVLLKEIGGRLAFFSSKVRGFKPYRWGGDEFIAIVEQDATLDVESICQELTDLIAVPVTYESQTIWPTCSLGIAVCPDDARDLESLMIYADLALYKTKEMGRDGYNFFSAEMKEKVDNDIRIETDMRSALKLDQFELFFQPQISTVDEKITGIEALVRWNHPDQGQLPPGLFMDVVEQYGMASALGRRVFDMAMSAARQWTDQGFDFGRLAINLSPAHLKRQTLVDDFFESLDKYKVDPDCLAVELLESVLVDQEESNVDALFNQLASKGVHIELDDFGTGYASLSHLTNLPVDGIKIDRTFIDNIDQNEKLQAVVEVVMSMSRLMRLRVVSEGVETHEQLAAVSKISNCSVQGYLISRPLSFENMTSWMRDKRHVGILQPSEKTIKQSNFIR